MLVSQLVPVILNPTHRDLRQGRAGDAVAATLQVDHHLLGVLGGGDGGSVVDCSTAIVTLGIGIVGERDKLQQSSS